MGRAGLAACLVVSTGRPATARTTDGSTTTRSVSFRSRGRPAGNHPHPHHHRPPANTISLFHWASCSAHKRFQGKQPTKAVRPKANVTWLAERSELAAQVERPADCSSEPFQRWPPLPFLSSVSLLDYSFRFSDSIGTSAEI